MTFQIDETHDVNLESWVESANDPETDFPIQNLPLCTLPEDDVVATVIGDQVLDLFSFVESDAGGAYLHSIKDEIEEAGATREGLFDLFDHWPGGPFEASGAVRRLIRRILVDLLRRDNPILRDDPEFREQVLSPLDQVDLALPTRLTPGNYTDFYASLYHATNVGSMFRPDNPLLPNYKHMPIAYHGRASSIVPSGTEIRRPCGQRAPVAGPREAGDGPTFGACRLLDYELEVGLIVGRGNELGEPIPIEQAEDHVLGMVLVNDWSARDIQKWEYQPLGPFLAKSFATTVSPFIVTMEALAPFRTPALDRPQGDPSPLPYLTSEQNREAGGIDITLEVFIQSEQMRERGFSPMRLSRGNFKDMYWTVAQMVAHHTCNGCNLRPGDLLASGTISGPTREARGCLLELSWDGDPWASPPRIFPGTQRTPIQLPTGESRTFLEDGDEVVIRGFCEREGFRRIGFGTCRGRIVPAAAP